MERGAVQETSDVMTTVRALFTFPHYYDHCLPIIDVLRDHGVTVDVYSTRPESIWGRYIHSSSIQESPRSLWMVASSIDASKCTNQDLIYVEHGAGQTYPGDTGGLNNAGYSDGPMDGAVLFLCPNLFTMNRRQQRYPSTPAFLVGCPRMDQFYGKAVGWHEGVERDVVALSWHWNGGVVQETKSCFDEYRPHFNALVLGLRRKGLRVVGTAHPRIAKKAMWHYERHGIEWWDTERVLYEAAVLCVDNSSIGFEFASLDRPVVWLNGAHYRRHVHHGLRFWEAIPGAQCDRPEDLEEIIVSQFENPGEWHDERELVTAKVYPLRDGNSALRAAMAIETLL